MEFSLHAPPRAIAHSVKAIWRARGTKEEFDAPEPIVPDGCVEIIFNLGDRFINAETRELQPRDLLAGQMTRPVVALPTGNVDLIGVRFHTARSGIALRRPMFDLQDQLVDASSILAGTDRIADDLRNVADDDRISHLELALASRLASTETPAAIAHALALVESSNGVVPIENVATRIGVSRRHLERLFREYVGLGAKHFARICRMHCALKLLQQRADLSGADIAFSCGYSDQAHLIRECQQLAGRTPQRLKSTERSLSGFMRHGAERAVSSAGVCSVPDHPSGREKMGDSHLTSRATGEGR